MEKSKQKLQFPVEFIKKHNALILENTENKTIVGFTEKTSGTALRLMKKLYRSNAEFKKIPQRKILNYLDSEYNEEHTSSKDDFSDSSQQIDGFNEDAPTINFVNTILREAIFRKASDIHIEGRKKNAVVRYRIEGILTDDTVMDKEKFEAASSRLKLMANLNILEKRLPQDGRISVETEEGETDMRISIIPTSGGESIALRILGRTNSFTSLKEIGFSTKQISDIHKMISIPHGLILVTGPTGSGKSTTLNVLLNMLTSSEKKIISIEDPVEFYMKDVNQIQVNESTGLTFESILRRVLRQDPNIIMVGEIRDKETAELCVKAALTGHLVLSTLHTNDALGSITRLSDMGIEPYLIAAVLRGTIAQRLVRKKNGGRIVIAEEFLMTRKLEEYISKKSDSETLEKILLEEKMIFMKDDAKSKIKKGIIDASEAKKEVMF